MKIARETSAEAFFLLNPLRLSVLARPIFGSVSTIKSL
jgi:hypothetical protein